MLTVPADFVPDLRSGLFGEWGFAAEDLANMALQFGGHAPGGVYRDPLESFDASRTLLDVVGWRSQTPPTEISIDLGWHHLYPKILTKALVNEQIALAERLEEMPRTTSEYARQSMRRRIETLGSLAAAVEAKAQRLKPPEPMAARLPRWSGSGFLEDLIN